LVALPGKFDLSRQAFEAVITHHQHAGFAEHKFLVLCLTELGDLYNLLADYEQSLKYVDEAVSMQTRLYTDIHMMSAAMSSDHIGLSALKIIKGHVLYALGK
jgi:hypothetical protein